MQTVGIDTNSTALPAVRMLAPKMKISVGISSSPPAAKSRRFLAYAGGPQPQLVIWQHMDFSPLNLESPRSPRSSLRAELERLTP
jgi:hypothetical protein